MTLYDILEIGFKTGVIVFLFLSLRWSKNMMKWMKDQDAMIHVLIEEAKRKNKN